MSAQKLRCRVERLDATWDVIHLPGAIDPDPELFLAPLGEIENGIIEVDVVSVDGAEALVDVPYPPICGGAECHRFRVQSRALVN